MNLLMDDNQVAISPLDALDADVFQTHFNRSPFKIGHNLVDHPLFTLPRLIQLAQQLPQSRVEYNAGNLPISQDPTCTPLNGLSIDETIQRIEQCRSWMVLKNVELDDDYRQLLDDCLDMIKPYSDLVAPGMTRREAFIFITSPGSVTPFHIDPENNFLLQIRGDKEVTLFDSQDRTVLPERDIEGFYTGAHRNLNYQEAFAERGQRFELTPGEGLHFPVIAPHWVKNGPAVSISFSITFRTESSDSLATLYRLNAQLRRWHLRPKAVGASPLLDSIKLGLISNARRLKRRLRGGK
jgi:hypothetical protein